MKNLKVLYRIEIVEITKNYGDIERISSPVYSIDDLKIKLEHFMIDFNDMLKDRNKYYIKIIVMD